LALVTLNSFFIMAVLSLGSVPAHAAIAYVSASHTICPQASSGASTQTCTLAAPTTAGNDVVVGLAWESTGSTIGNVRGSVASSYFSLYAAVCNSGSECVATLVCHKCAAQTAVTTTMTDGTAFVTTVEEYSGVQALGITGTKTASSTNPGLTLATGDANDWTVCATASLGAGVPTAGSGNLRNAGSTGAIAGTIVDNTASSAGSVACADTIASGAWAAAGIELLAVAPRTYIWPDCDTAHPCVVHHIDTVAAGTAENEKPNGFEITTEPSSPGNLLTLSVTHVSTKTVAVSDNKGGSWQSAVTTTNAADQIETQLFYVCGAATGTNVVTIQLSAPPAPGEVLQFSYNEVSGIAPSSCIDGAAGANGLTGDLQPGPIATTTDGDMIYNFAEESYNYPEEDNPIGWVMPDNNSALLMENAWDKFASQVSVQAAHGAYDPTLYVNADPNDRKWNSVAAAFKPSAGAGTQPTGIHVTRLMHYYNPHLPLTPASLPFPSTGNAIVISSAYPSSGYEGDMTDVGDSQGDTWTRTPFTVANDDPQIYYTCLGSEAGSRDLTISWLPDTGTTHMIVYDIAGAKTTGGATGCVGATVNSQIGNQPSTANASIIGAPVITPEASNSVVIAVNMLGLGPPSGTLTPGVIFTSIWATGMTDATNADSGDCYGYIYTTSTSPISFSWQMANSISAPNGGSAYDAAALEILPATAAAPGSETLTVTNSPVVYNGSPQAAVVSGSVPGAVSGVLYNGSATVPTAAGTYAVTANFTPQNTAEYSTLTGASAGNFVISKATPTVTVTPGQASITTAQALSATVIVSGGTGNPRPTGSVKLSSGSYTSATTTLTAGSATINIPAGSLAVGSDTLTATYTPDSGSSSTYNGATGTAPVTVVQAIGSCSTANPNPNPNPESFAAIGDFNGDCKSDILWRNSTTEQVYEWLMNGTTYSGSGSPGTLTSDWVIQGAGDFNGDGHADILWRNSTTGEVVIWLMNGTTTASSTSLGYVSSDWVIQGVGDFNGDGKADILWRNSTTGQVYVWLMNGTTMSGGGSVSYVSSGWNIAGIGDFNGDGKADILWRNSTTGQVYVWLMNGTTLASMGSPGTPTSGWSIAGVGDFDGNGTSDILWSNSTTRQIYIWFMNGTTMSSTGSVAFVSSGWNIQGVGDYDGSGRAGILWRNSTTEQVYVWLMNGATITSTGSPGTPAASWEIAP
jgi:hypothetical protein